jgi:GT2 family glycosyltransferase
MKYSIVIPTYNNCEKYLKPCVDSVIKHSNMDEVELIISANGCTDNTRVYLDYLVTAVPGLKVIWNDAALGYSGANNVAIKAATCDKIVLLNNDTILLDQPRNHWLGALDGPFKDPDCGISCVIRGHSEPAGCDFAVFFCVMIHRKVFDKIGLLNEEYGVGGGEDTEFCIEAEKAGFKVLEVFEKVWEESQYVGVFPIYHKGEGTMYDTSLVQGWENIFLINSLKLAKKYNKDWYRWRLSNFWERAVFLKGDQVFPREVTRYEWAAKNLIGNSVFELGCTNGYGRQFFPENINYIGLDYDPIIVDVAKEQGWHGANNTFVSGDINEFILGQYDTIVAFEVIEHIDNGLEIVEKFKKHCKRLLITVPMNEPPGFWGPHHKLHGLNERHFPGFEFNYINEQGEISDVPHDITTSNPCNLMICKWTASE